MSTDLGENASALVPHDSVELVPPAASPTPVPESADLAELEEWLKLPRLVSVAPTNGAAEWFAGQIDKMVDARINARRAAATSALEKPAAASK